MKKYPLIATLLIIATLLVAATCETCKDDVACLIPPFDHFEFSYVSSDGEDLLNGKYEPSDIKIFSLDAHGNRVDANLYFRGGSPMVVNAQLVRDIERSFLEVKGEVTDTLDFEFQYHDTECCGTYSDIIKITLVDEEYSGEQPITILGE